LASTRAPAAAVPNVAAAPAAGAGGPKKDDDWKWWYYVGAGAMMIGLAFFELSRLSDLDEGTVKSVRLKAWEAAVYSILGKWGVFALLFALGLFLAGFGVYQFIQERKQAAR
jgi:hypothetical protein